MLVMILTSKAFVYYVKRGKMKVRNDFLHDRFYKSADIMIKCSCNIFLMTFI